MFKKLLLIFFLLVPPVYATDNPKLIGFPQNKSIGFRGLDTSSTVNNLEDGRATDLLNVRLSSAYDLQKRYGSKVIIGTLSDWWVNNAPITGIYQAEYSDGTRSTYAFLAERFKYDNTTIWSTGTQTSINFTSGQNYQFICTTALDYAVCTNDQDRIAKISSAETATELSTSSLTYPVTKAKAIKWFRNYLILGNTYENSADKATRFRWSNVGTIETWSDNDYDDIASLSGDEIQGFVEMYGDLYIIMRKSIWKASLVGGDDIFVYTKMVEGVGAIAKGSIQLLTFPEYRQAVAFLTEDKKIYLFNGVTVIDIGSIIQPTLDTLSASRLEYATGIFDGTRYILSVTTSSLSYNDTVLIYDTEVGEWTKYSQIDANAWARVKDVNSNIKTYFGNYDGFVYEFENTDNEGYDVDAAQGIFDSASTLNIQYVQTGAEVLLDTTLPSGSYTGAIVRITSGTGADEETVVLSHTTTYLVVTTAFTTTPDSTSSYSIGDIPAYYNTKWYDFGDSPRIKLFKGVYIWADETSNNQVTMSYGIDFGSTLGSETINLSPSSSSVWDSAIWDSSTWGSSGSKWYPAKLKGKGRYIQLKFENSDIDETFDLYGFHILGESLDVE